MALSFRTGWTSGDKAVSPTCHPELAKGDREKSRIVTRIVTLGETQAFHVACKMTAYK